VPPDEIDPEDDYDFGPSLVRDFRALSAADMSVIMEGAKRPGATLLTSRGSANDLFWQKLSVVKWTEQVALPEGLASSPLADKFIAWSVTELGAISLPMLFRSAAQ